MRRRRRGERKRRVGRNRTEDRSEGERKRRKGGEEERKKGRTEDRSEEYMRGKDWKGKKRKRREGEYSIRYNSICIIIYNI